MNGDTNFKGDMKVISQIVAGDKDQFKVLYHRYKRHLFLTCLRYIPERNLAEDVLQDSFIVIYKDLINFDLDKGSFISWASKITINQCLKKFRKKSVFSKMDGLLEIKYKFSVRSKAVEKLNLEDMTNLINSLPKGYRVVFNMYVIDGYNHREISEKLNISESTSKTQLMRARRLIKNTLKEEDYKLIESYA